MTDKENAIREHLSEVLSSKEINTPEKLQAELRKSGIDVEFTDDKNGISEATFTKDNLTVKGPATGYNWEDISKALTENKARVQELRKANPHLPKSFLAAHLEKEKGKSLYVGGQPGSPAVTVPKFASTPSPSMVAEKPKEIRPEGLQPTTEELKELDFAKDYNPRIERALSEIRSELHKGNTGVDVPAIMEKNGFRSVKDRFVYSNGTMQNGIAKKSLESPLREVRQQKENFDRHEQRYKNLMNREPVEVTLLDKLAGRAGGKQEANQTLQRGQKEAVKPEFKPQVHGLESRDFQIHPKFEQREHEHKRQQEVKQVATSARIQDQDQNKGLSR